MQRERLLTLARFLESKPVKEAHEQERFDMDSFFNPWAAGENRESVCGFAGCALGFATLIPEFKELGLRMYNSNVFFEPEGHEVSEGIQTGVDLFDIPWDAACWLFGGNYYEYPSKRVTSPRMVATRIRKLLKDPRAYMYNQR